VDGPAELASVIDVTCPRKSRSWDGVRRHHKALPADEVTIEEGIPVTTVPRTILDLAATEPLEVVKSLLREMEFRELRDPLSLRDMVRRYPGRRGVRKVRMGARRPEGRTWRRAQEPPGGALRPVPSRPPPAASLFNDRIEVGGKSFQVDCHWADLGQIVELDGWQGHKTRTAFREDRARDRRLGVAGCQVTRLTWNQLDDEPGAIAADLRVLLGIER
jgi:hypothetical protein